MTTDNSLGEKMIAAVDLGSSKIALGHRLDGIHSDYLL